MLLRPRQEVFVANCINALNEVGNTLGVAPTGAGKSVMMAAVADHYIKAGGHALVLQHRDELVAQNQRRLKAYAPGTSTGTVNANEKVWNRQATFAMVQTLSLKHNLRDMHTADLLIVDEAHHIIASSYLRIIEAAVHRNPKVKILGVTATASRGDGKGLRKVFTNVADVITISELVKSGHLVKPRTYVIDLGVQEELQGVKKSGADYDMEAVAEIMNHQVISTEAVERWQELAGDRRTIAFCSNVAHAHGVCAAFQEKGVKAAVVHGDLADSERKRVLDDLSTGKLQVVVNVAVLTEGFDCPPVACVLLFRPSSHKGTMIQMIGRGLRVVDPEEHPGVVKNDCVVIDFGTSVLQHGSLESEVDLSDAAPSKSSKSDPKVCPECSTELPWYVRDCPICGHHFQGQQVEEAPILENFTLTEIDLLEASPFRWEHNFYGDTMSVATAFSAWAICAQYKDGLWHAFGGAENTKLRHIAFGDRLTALAAADDFLREHGDKLAASKTKKWLTQPATDKQLAILKMPVEQSFGVTKYRAGCAITLQWQLPGIKTKLADYEKKVTAAQGFPA